MIKFFRQIRYKLMNENKTGKYFKYAIGEIILVVIGILIALQINNWNEQNKEDALEQEYYCRLLEDVDQDIEQIDGNIESVQTRLKSSNNAVRLLNKSEVNKVEIGRELAFSINAILSDFSSNTSAFEDLKSGSNLNIIKDKSIIKAINNYLKNTEAYLSIIKVNGDISLDRFFSYKDLFSTGWVHFQKESIRYRDYMEEDVFKMVEVDPNETITEDMQYQLLNDALRYISSNARQMQLYKSMKEESIKLKTLLETKCSD